MLPIPCKIIVSSKHKHTWTERSILTGSVVEERINRIPQLHMHINKDLIAMHTILIST